MGQLRKLDRPVPTPLCYCPLLRKRNCFGSIRDRLQPPPRPSLRQERFFLRTFGTAGNGVNQFYYPAGIAFGPDSLLFVANLHGQRIKVLDRNGTEVRQFTTPGYPRSLSFSGDKLAVAMGDHHKVLVYDKNGTLERTISNGSASSNPGSFNHPYGLAFDSSDRLPSRTETTRESKSSTRTAATKAPMAFMARTVSRCMP